MTLPGLSDLATVYVDAIIEAVRREYPNAPRHVRHSTDDRPEPHEIHPAFYGCFDWHSSVEMHWVLARMLRAVPDAVPEADVRAVLDQHLSAAALAAEADYIRERPRWERPHGHGWALALAAELGSWDDEDARRWSANLRPLVDVIATGFVEWLPRRTYPERAGTHGNSAFALTRSLPLARARAEAGDAALLDTISDAAVRWFASDIEYPAAWEPNGDDFLSPALTEAELIAAIARPAEAFPQWLGLFLPDLVDGLPEALMEPVDVSNHRDGDVAHLVGLNLYRAYAFGLLADFLDDVDPRREILRAARMRHAAVSLPRGADGAWATGNLWLVSHAVLLLS